MKIKLFMLKFILCLVHLGKVLLWKHFKGSFQKFNSSQKEVGGRDGMQAPS